MPRKRGRALSEVGAPFVFNHFRFPFIPCEILTIKELTVNFFCAVRPFEDGALFDKRPYPCQPFPAFCANPTRCAV